MLKDTKTVPVVSVELETPHSQETLVIKTTWIDSYQKEES